MTIEEKFQNEERPINGRFSLFWLMFIVAIFAFLFGWSIEGSFGDPIREIVESPPARDAKGRDLYILLVDSLALDNVEKLPSLQTMAQEGFSAPVQPCVDNFTSACVREAFSGRPVFSLFAMLENFQVIKSTFQHDLIHDCKNAGLRTALISRGDLRGWNNLVDKDIRAYSVHNKAKDELLLGLSAAKKHNLVIHHWIWHDVTSHRAKKGSSRYDKSLSRVEFLIQSFKEKLPSTTDFMVMGDHGHTPNGRHIQGLDTPTFVAIRSPNLNPLSLTERIPISAIRYLAAGITGVGTHHAQLESRWKHWFSSHIGDEIREAGRSLKTRRSHSPSGAFVFAFLMGIVSCWILNVKVGLLVCIWSILLGLSYPDWVQHTQFRIHRYNVMKVSWLLPTLGAFYGWFRWRTLKGLWSYAMIGSFTLFFMLWPGLFTNGVLRNMPVIVAPVFVGMAAAFVNRSGWKQSENRWIVLLLILFLALVALCNFRSNFFRLRYFPFEKNISAFQDFFPFLIALLSVGFHRCIDTSNRWAFVAGISAFLGPFAHKYLHALAFVSILALLFFGRGQFRRRWISLLVLFACGYVFQPYQQMGIGLLVLLFALSSLVTCHPILQAEKYRTIILWGRALLLVCAAQLALAWTIRLNVSGINFNFAIQWVEGTWHKKLWWLIAIATVISAFFPLILILEAWSCHIKKQLQECLILGVRLALLRFVFSIIFTSLWIFRVGDEAISTRLRSLLQDGLGWFIIAAALYFFSSGYSKIIGYQYYDK